jgi:hypothetical protein
MFSSFSAILLTTISVLCPYFSPCRSAVAVEPKKISLPRGPNPLSTPLIVFMSSSASDRFVIKHPNAFAFQLILVNQISVNTKQGRITILDIE